MVQREQQSGQIKYVSFTSVAQSSQLTDWTGLRSSLTMACAPDGITHEKEWHAGVKMIDAWRDTQLLKLKRGFSMTRNATTS